MFIVANFFLKNVGLFAIVQGKNDSFESGSMLWTMRVKASEVYLFDILAFFKFDINEWLNIE